MNPLLNTVYPSECHSTHDGTLLLTFMVFSRLDNRRLALQFQFGRRRLGSADIYICGEYFDIKLEQSDKLILHRTYGITIGEDYSVRQVDSIERASRPGNRYYLLDLTRGIAALAVLLWHYQNFFLWPTQHSGQADELRATVGATNYPFYSILFPFYDHGFLAVTYFWILSGFVFFLVYRDRQVGGRDFLAHRVARLYPLHLVTLVAVAALQILSIRSTGAYQIYELNDLKHFFLQLFFASNWGFQRGDSFNVPVWSVSIEVLIYVVFFFYYRFCRVTLLSAIVMFCVFALVFKTFRSVIPFCGMSFFAGGIVFLLNEGLKQQRPIIRFGGPLLALCLAVLLSIVISINFPLGSTTVLIIRLLVFPIFVLVLATLEQSVSRSIRTMSRIGDVTYALYLIHVPIQIVIMLSVASFGLNRSFALSDLFFLAFFAGVIALAFLVFVFFERPAQRIINKRLSSIHE